MIEEAHVASSFQRFKVRAVGTDPTHVHVLVSWRDDWKWERLRDGLRTSLTRRLNKQFEKRNWFVDGASRKQVSKREHYDYLVETYLPDHPGWKWSLEKGLYL